MRFLSFVHGPCVTVLALCHLDAWNRRVPKVECFHFLYPHLHHQKLPIPCFMSLGCFSHYQNGSQLFWSKRVCTQVFLCFPSISSILQVTFEEQNKPRDWWQHRNLRCCRTHVGWWFHVAFLISYYMDSCLHFHRFNLCMTNEHCFPLDFYCNDLGHNPEVKK